MPLAAFAADRQPLFPPLSAQERARCAAVLQRLHAHLHGPDADHGAALTRERVLHIAGQMLAAASPRDADPGSAERLLQEFRRQGWLEDHVDPANLQPLLRFTREGRAFAEAFGGLEEPRAATRQRHLRGTGKALAAFVDTLEPDELLDAYEHAAHVAQDLQEDIDHFRNRVGALAREALEQKIAWAEFSEFASRRLGGEASAQQAAQQVAESAERHRDQVVAQLQRLRALTPQVLAPAAAALPVRAAWLAAEARGEHPVLWLADRIDAMVDSACSIKLPVLRQETGRHVKRVAGLLRQLLALDHGARAPLQRCAARLMQDAPADRGALLDTLGGLMATSRVRLPAGSVRWRDAGRTGREAAATREALVLEQALHSPEAVAFTLSDLEILARLKRRCGGRVLRLSELPAGDVADVLVSLHAVAAARSPEGRKHFEVRKLAARFHTGYFAATDYELVPRKETQ